MLLSIRLLFSIRSMRTLRRIIVKRPTFTIKEVGGIVTSPKGPFFQRVAVDIKVPFDHGPEGGIGQREPNERLHFECDSTARRFG